MYFSTIPNIQYDQKPQSFPFSNSDFVVAKNFFRRFQVNPDIFDYVSYYKKYAIQNDTRIETLAESIYDNAGMDWIIALTNNITNIYTDWPVSNYTLQKRLESEYDDPYATIAYYEVTKDVKNDSGTVFLKKGQKVDKTFYDGNYQYNLQDATNTISTIAGNTISAPVTIFEDESKKNESKREIYLLKGQFIRPLINELKKQSTYNKCSAYVSSKLKQTLV